jgi:hypothetical protein
MRRLGIVSGDGSGRRLGCSVAEALVRADAWLDGGDEPGGVAGTPPPAVHLGVLADRVVDDEDVIG